MLSVCKRFYFEAAHNLPMYSGACNRQHGHSYVLEVEVSGKIQPVGSCAGMIIDFSELKAIVNDTVITNLDHYNLNDIYDNPTAEEMVMHLKGVLKKYFDTTKTRLIRLRLYETKDSYAEWKEN
jgi:6-pyruvoyltetrahydropterin/6-carboxytetrahydropterin synthase